jgi:hypothetical protein
MKKIFLLFLFLLTACSIKSAGPSPIPTHLAPEPTRTALPAPTATISPDAYPYPVNDPAWQGTPYPAPLETEVSTPAPLPTLTRTPTQTITPTPTIIRPTPTFPSSLTSLRIAFASEKKLFIWDKGETRLLTELEEGTYSVSYSSDGEIIAYPQSSGLWAINADGSGKRLLVEKYRLQVVNPEVPEKKSMLSQFKWIPNTHRLLLNTEADLEEHCCYTPNNDLYVVDADTLNIQTLLPLGKSGTIFNISPDGKRVALVSSGGIDLLNLNPREKHNLIHYEPVMVPSEGGGYLSPRWSSDSQYLMVVVPPPDIHYGTQLPSKIWKLPVNHQPPTLVSTIGAEFGLFTLSPSFLIIATDLPMGMEQGVLIANVDGSGNEIYQTGQFFFRGWSPDSKYFIYDNQIGTSYLGQKGASPVELHFSTDNLRWLDNQNFLYQKGPNQAGEIRLGFLDGSSILLIGPSPLNNYDFTR